MGLRPLGSCGGNSRLERPRDQELSDMSQADIAQLWTDTHDLEYAGPPIAYTNTYGIDTGYSNYAPADYQVQYFNGPEPDRINQHTTSPAGRVEVSGGRGGFLQRPVPTSSAAALAGPANYHQGSQSLVVYSPYLPQITSAGHTTSALPLQPSGLDALTLKSGHVGHGLGSSTLSSYSSTIPIPYTMSSDGGSQSSDSPSDDGSVQGSPVPPTSNARHGGAYTMVNPRGFPSSNDPPAAVYYSTRAAAAPKTTMSLALSTSPPQAPGYGAIGNSQALQYRGGRQSRDLESMPFPDFQNHHPLMCEGHLVMPEIEAQIVRNVTWEGGHWTCYRRNYISVTCSYTLTPIISGKELRVDTGQGLVPVRALAMSLRAVADKADGKEIPLVQFTPKRDAGDKEAVRMEKLYPKARLNSAGYAALSDAPLLPYQNDDDTHSQGLSTSTSRITSANFDRIQFKSATLNNGRRRNNQQFYQLLVGLYADVRSPTDTEAKWMKVAHQVSPRMVVRGRSPSHYNATKNKKNDDSGSGSGGGSSGASGGSRGHRLSGHKYGSVSGTGTSALYSKGTTYGPTGTHNQRQQVNYARLSPTFSNPGSSVSSISSNSSDNPTKVDMSPVDEKIYKETNSYVYYAYTEPSLYAMKPEDPIGTSTRHLNSDWRDDKRDQQGSQPLYDLKGSLYDHVPFRPSNPYPQALLRQNAPCRQFEAFNSTRGNWPGQAEGF